MATTVNTRQIKIAKRYAGALSAFGNRDEIFNELSRVQQTLLTSADLKSFLANPIITIEDKKDIVDKVFADVSVQTKNFLLVLIDKNRFAYFDTIMDEFSREIDTIHNITRVEILSAVELTAEEKNRLKDVLQRKMSCNVESQYAIEPTIIGGLIIKIGDRVIDNSLKSNFEGLKRQLI